MLLQLNLNEPQHLALLPQMQGVVDIIAIGNLLLKRFGLTAITTARELCPQTLIFADSQILNGAQQEADMLFNAGAAFINVLGCASPTTIEAVGARADAYGATVVLDMTMEQDKESILPEGINLPASYGYIAVNSLAGAHKLHMSDKAVLLHVKDGAIEIDAAIAAAPRILAIGSAIVQTTNAREAAQQIKNRLPERGLGWPWDKRLVTID